MLFVRVELQGIYWENGKECIYGDTIMEKNIRSVYTCGR